MAGYRKSISGSQAEFNRFLERMGDAMRERLTAALLENGERLATEIRAAAPHDAGALQQSVRVEDQTKKKNPRVYVKAGGPLTTHGGPRGTYDYANAVEFGTRKMPARPFFYPTYRRLKLEIRRDITEAMQTALDVNLRSFRS